MHNEYIVGRSENNMKCVIMHNDLGRKNQTTPYDCRYTATSLALRVILSVLIVVELIQFFHGAIHLYCFADLLTLFNLCSIFFCVFVV